MCSEWALEAVELGGYFNKETIRLYRTSGPVLPPAGMRGMAVIGRRDAARRDSDASLVIVGYGHFTHRRVTLRSDWPESMVLSTSHSNLQQCYKILYL